MYIFRSVILVVAALHLPPAFSKEDDDSIHFCTGSALSNYTPSGARAIRTIRHNLEKLTIPPRFDARKKWPFCKSLKTIYNQGKCDGCWAFATVMSMSDRLCIATNGRFNEMISIQEVLECCTNCVDKGDKFKGGCKTGYMYKSFMHWESAGIVTEKCKPVFERLKDGTPMRFCRKRCTGGDKSISYGLNRVYGVQTLSQFNARNFGLKHIQAEIMLNGPVVMAFNIFKYMTSVPSNAILKYDSNMTLGKYGGPHAVRIIGWDVVNDVPVWIMANSWGPKWCNKGYCYIRRGKNDFYCETKGFTAGIPKINRLRPVKGSRENVYSGFTRNLNTDLVIVSMLIICYNVH